MILDLNEASDEKQLDTDICVIGSGPVGLSFVSQFFQLTHLSIYIIESGKDVRSADADELNRVVSSGDVSSGDMNSRARVFGGTSTLWGGQVLTLDAMDFEKRKWVPNSGWPFSKKELEKDYVDAADILDIGKPCFDDDIWHGNLNFKKEFSISGLDLKYSKWAPMPDFAKKYRSQIRRSEHIRLVLNATACHIAASKEKPEVKNIEIRDSANRAFKVFAKYYLLCAGGIENARLLLASNIDQENRLGNQHGNLGRYYQDHCAYYGCKLTPLDFDRFSNLLSSYFLENQMYLPKLSLSRSRQKNDKTLNVNANIEVETSKQSSIALKRVFNSIKSGQYDKELLSNVRTALSHPIETFRLGYAYSVSKRMYFPKTADYYLISNCETSPNPESRITLCNSLDRQGVPKANIKWLLNESARHTLRVFNENIADQFAKHNIASVVVQPFLYDLENWKEKAYSIYHHIGATRMSRDPKSGVVDENCKLNGIDNVFLGGSSIFPTSGAANPTFTAIALVLRLARHLKKNYLHNKQL